MESITTLKERQKQKREEQTFFHMVRQVTEKTLADYYSNTGSMYLTSLVFIPLGLSAENIFWNSPAESWTQKKAWAGEPFPKDYAVDY